MCYGRLLPDITQQKSRPCKKACIYYKIPPQNTPVTRFAGFLYHAVSQWTFPYKGAPLHLAFPSEILSVSFALWFLFLFFITSDALRQEWPEVWSRKLSLYVYLSRLKRKSQANYLTNKRNRSKIT